MTVGVSEQKPVSYMPSGDEYTVPVRGFLFEKGRLKGIYVKEGLLPVTEVLPKEVNEAVLRGKAQKNVVVRESKDALEVSIVVEYRTWPVFVTIEPS